MIENHSGWIEAGGCRVHYLIERHEGGQSVVLLEQPMDRRLEQIASALAENAVDYTPPWGLPSRTDFEALSGKYGCRFPPSFISYQTEYAARIPADNGFMWANPDLEPYLSLEDGIVHARRWGVPEHYVPFWTDEGNFLCFDTSRPSTDGEFPIVFWEHDAPADDLDPSWDGFSDWLADLQEKRRRRRAKKD
jgi:SMI1-KNR4 cell-wall